MTLSFFVEGTPTAQPRVKAARRGGFVQIYTPATAKAWKTMVGLRAKEAMRKDGSGPFVGAVYLGLEFSMLRPDSHFNAKREIKKSSRKHMTCKPDLDNLEKAAMDALTTAGVWMDDCQVVIKKSSKAYLGHEGVQIVISEVE